MRNQSRSNKNRFTSYVIGSIQVAVITPRKQTLSLCLRSTLYKERSFFSYNRALYGPTRNVSRQCEEVCRPKAKSWSPSQWKLEANRFCYYKETCLQFGIYWLFGFKILLQHDRGCFCSPVVIPLDIKETWSLNNPFNMRAQGNMRWEEQNYYIRVHEQ